MTRTPVLWALIVLLMAALVWWAATSAEYLAMIYTTLETVRHDANAFAVLSRAAKEQG